MLDIENDFFTQYKYVDAICRDMFLGEHIYNDRGAEVFGVSAYIRTMEKESYYVRSLFSDWDHQYKTLKRLRWLRSQIAHSVEVSECSENDLDDIERFYQQLMTQSDILARVNRLKNQQAGQTKASSHAFAPPTTDDIPADQRENKEFPSRLWILGIVALILIVLLVFSKSMN